MFNILSNFNQEIFNLLEGVVKGRYFVVKVILLLIVCSVSFEVKRPKDKSVRAYGVPPIYTYTYVELPIFSIRCKCRRSKLSTNDGSELKTYLLKVI